MTQKMLIDLGRCVGCWTCSMACKVGNHLPDEDYRVTVRTNGSGAGIDRPSGVYPDLSMNWMPIYQKSCTFCAPRTAEGEKPFCVNACPTQALAFGDDNDPDSDFAKAAERCKDLHYHEFEIPTYEGTRSQVVYFTRS